MSPMLWLVSTSLSGLSLFTCRFHVSPMLQSTRRCPPFFVVMSQNLGVMLNSLQWLLGPPGSNAKKVRTALPGFSLDEVHQRAVESQLEYRAAHPRKTPMPVRTRSRWSTPCWGSLQDKLQWRRVQGGRQSRYWGDNSRLPCVGARDYASAECTVAKKIGVTTLIKSKHYIGHFQSITYIHGFAY